MSRPIRGYFCVLAFPVGDIGGKTDENRPFFSVPSDSESQFWFTEDGNGTLYSVPKTSVLPVRPVIDFSPDHRIVIYNRRKCRQVLKLFNVDIVKAFHFCQIKRLC